MATRRTATPTVTLLASCFLASVLKLSSASAACANDEEDETISAMQSVKQVRRHGQEHEDISPPARALLSKRRGGEKCADLGCDFYDPDVPCACNAKCAKHENCCSDYEQQCGEDASAPESSGSVTTGDGSDVQIAVVTTAGASLPCCGKPKSECKLKGGNFTYSMAEAIVEGIKETAPKATVKLIDLVVECPSPRDMSVYDAVIAGAPVWNGIPSPDILSWMDDWPISDSGNKMRCKLGAAFTTGGGYYAGIQTTIETFHRLFQTFQMVIVGGPAWQTGQGAAAVTGTEPFEEGAYMAEDGKTEIAAPQFLADARGLGARVGNFTSIMKTMPAFCDVYLGLTASSKR